MTRHPPGALTRAALSYFFLSPPPAGALRSRRGSRSTGSAAAAAAAAGAAPQRRRSRSTSRSRSGSRSRLQLFRVAGRRHDGHQRHVLARQRLHAGRQLDVGQMQRVADFQRADVGLDELRNVLDRALELDRVGDDVDGAAALHAGRTFRLHDVQGNADADGGAFAEPHEVHVDREILDRIEMEVARNHAVLLAVQIDVENRGQEPACQDALAQFAYRRPRSVSGGWLLP